MTRFSVTFRVPIEPKGKGRGRAALAISDKLAGTLLTKAQKLRHHIDGKGYDGARMLWRKSLHELNQCITIRTPTKTSEWSSQFRLLSRRFRPNTPLDGPVAVDVVAVFARPKTRPATVDKALWAHGGRIWRPSKPDRDNIDKIVLDALNDDYWFDDDASVCDGRVQKVYAAAGESPGVLVRVRQLPPLEPPAQRELGIGTPAKETAHV